jgi:hypothetical protein
LILTVAFGLRLGFAWSYQHPRPSRALGAIPFLQESGNVAYSLANGKGFASPFRVDTGPTAWLTPVYPLLLAGIFRLFGIYSFHAFLAAVALNILFSACTCVPIFFAGERISGRGVGACGAWLWAVFPNAILLSVESMWDQSLGALLAAVVFWATLALPGSRRWRDWCGYGVLWGLTLMTNPALFSLLPFFLGWLAYRVGRLNFARPCAALCVTILCCVPWTVRNYIVFHTFVPFRSTLGLSLWLGNNEHAEGRSVGSMHPISSSVERNRYIELGEVAYMREKERQAARFMLTNTRVEIHLIRDRFLQFWSGGTPHPVADFFRFRSAWFRFVLLFNLAAAVGAFAGIAALYRRRDSAAFPAAAYAVVFPCVYYLTLAIPRYRHPIDPVLLLLTAIALQAVVQPMAILQASQ